MGRGIAEMVEDMEELLATGAAVQADIQEMVEADAGVAALAEVAVEAHHLNLLIVGAIAVMAITIGLVAAAVVV